jgi:L-lactate dehydrogenase complex protein LldG
VKINDLKYDGEAMSTDLVTTFIGSVEDMDVGTSRVSSEDLAETIEDVAVGDTVVAEFPFDTDVYEEADDPTTEEIERAQTGVTAGAIGIASYGTVIVTPTHRKEGPVSLYPHRHVAVVRKEDIVADVETAFDRLESEFEQGNDDAIFVTGPSSTGDMGELIRGVHGPAEMHVIVVDDK